MKIEENNKTTLWLSIGVVLFVAINLRAPITAVSPILDEIKSVLQINNLQASLLTSIPLIVFASCSILVSKAISKFNIRHSLIFSILILIVGLSLRIYGNIELLYIGSLLLGIGICIGNVLTPAYIKELFPNKIGIMTGIFSVSMSLVAALASGLSISIGKWTESGWKGSLGIWIIGALIALIIVVLESFFGKKIQSKVTKTTENIKFNIFRSSQAWNISIFMGTQSLIYYCLVALLPTLLIDFGMSKIESGWVFSILQLAMLPAMLISPMIASKMKNPKIMVNLTTILYCIGIILLITKKNQFVYLSAILIGFAGGLAFSLSILFFSIRSKTIAGTIKISGMAQSIGYLIAAFGPPIFGKLYDFDSSWSFSLYFLLLAICVMTYFGRKACKPKFIEEN